MLILKIHGPGLKKRFGNSLTRDLCVLPIDICQKKNKPGDGLQMHWVGAKVRRDKRSQMDISDTDRNI